MQGDDRRLVRDIQRGRAPEGAGPACHRWLTAEGLRPETPRETLATRRWRPARERKAHMTNVRSIMTPDPVMVDVNATLIEAARKMKDKDIGDVLVTDENGQLVGIVTDRDIVVRGIAAGADVGTARVGDVCSKDVVTVHPESAVEHVVRVMRDYAVRRVPVVEDGKPLGVVSLGLLATQFDPQSVLGHISATHANH